MRQASHGIECASHSGMHRDLKTLADTQFDLVVVGGGSFGAAAARAAALRGLRTALIERADFGSGASAECFKMVHGGIRYLQHADIVRARSSCNERSAFLRTAPHLVKPLPIAVPTYGHGRRGKLFLSAGMRAFDALTCDRNRGIHDDARRISGAAFLSRSEAKRLFPLIDDRDLTGAAVFEDAQMYNPARLVLAMVESAVAAGAVACNYVEATGFLFNGDKVSGVEVTDCLTGASFAIKADLVLNAAGPWAEYLLRDRARFPQWQRGPFSRDAYFIVDRVPTSPYALAVSGLSRDQDAVLGRATRHLFLVPWRDKTLVGVWHRLFPQHPDTARIGTEELQEWLGELNAVNPDLKLTADEVSFSNCGLVPFGEHADAQSMQFGKETRFIDHRKTHGIHGLVTLIGIRYTMARADGELALEMLLSQWTRHPKSVDTTHIPLAGGAIDNIAALRAGARSVHPTLSPTTIDALICNHGTNYNEVMRHCAASPELRESIPGSHVIAAEIHHAVQSEMAVHLDDVVMRRTDLSGHQHPGVDALHAAAGHMAALLQWSPQRTAEELARTQTTLAKHHAIERSQSRPTRSENAVGAMLAEVSA
jgi:glycerol-3-phosphate dehydrogenase